MAFLFHTFCTLCGIYGPTYEAVVNSIKCHLYLSVTTVYCAPLLVVPFCNVKTVNHSIKLIADDNNNWIFNKALIWYKATLKGFTDTLFITTQQLLF